MEPKLMKIKDAWVAFAYPLAVYGATKEEAIKEMEEFIKEAQDALEELKK